MYVFVFPIATVSRLEVISLYFHLYKVTSKSAPSCFVFPCTRICVIVRTISCKSVQLLCAIGPCRISLHCFHPGHCRNSSDAWCFVSLSNLTTLVGDCFTGILKGLVWYFEKCFFFSYTSYIRRFSHSHFCKLNVKLRPAGVKLNLAKPKRAMMFIQFVHKHL